MQLPTPDYRHRAFRRSHDWLKSFAQWVRHERVTHRRFDHGESSRRADLRLSLANQVALTPICLQAGETSGSRIRRPADWAGNQTAHRERHHRGTPDYGSAQLVGSAKRGAVRDRRQTVLATLPPRSSGVDHHRAILQSRGITGTCLTRDETAADIRPTSARGRCQRLAAYCFAFARPAGGL